MRVRLFKARGYLCERCKAPGCPLELHHKTYTNLGYERDEDLEVVCHDCHKEADLEREKLGRLNAVSALYEARLDGWASKKYGEEWEQRDDADYIAEKFDDWADRQDGW